MTQIMGMAVVAPPELAIGAEVAMATAWATPRTAEAAPATCGAWAAASALALPKMNAWTAIRTRNPAQVRTNGVPRRTTPTVKAATASVARARPNPISLRGANRRPTILALRTDSRIWARAVEAKNRANGIGC